jgi:ABC-type antimicrobial peptide transport system ATPase subunit
MPRGRLSAAQQSQGGYGGRAVVKLHAVDGGRGVVPCAGRDHAGPCARLFEEINRVRGAAILFISHDLLSVASLSHRVNILSEGRIVESGSPLQIYWSPPCRVRRYYSGRGRGTFPLGSSTFHSTAVRQTQAEAPIKEGQAGHLNAGCRFGP